MIFLCILVTSITLNGHVATTHSKHPIIVLIAFDGFRYDFLERGLTPILQDLARNGSTSKYMMNQFPTVTFTNFHSISTGMHPETHGVLGNKIFDNSLHQCLEFGYELFHYNDDIVPIWLLNENTGDERYSGVMMWPGSHFKYQQKLSTFVQPFNQSVGWERRVDDTISWLVDNKTPANLILMYFEQPDENGHQHGPQSEQVDQELGKVNAIMTYYFQQLHVQGMDDMVNTIVVSDHGMETIDRKNILDLNNYIDPDAYTLCGFSPILQIQPKEGFESTVYRNLTKASSDTNKFVVYKRTDIPEEWHIKNNKRCSGIFIVNKPPYVFKDTAQHKGLGNHGYNNTELSMNPIFIAQGPIIKRNYRIQPFQNIDIYPFIAFVLNLQRPPVHVSPNGTVHFIRKILLNETYFRELSQ